MKSMKFTFGRQKNIKHSYHLGPAKTQVCKKNFMDTLDIKPGFIRGVVARKDPVTGAVRKYQRGKSMINYN